MHVLVLVAVPALVLCYAGGNILMHEKHKLFRKLLNMKRNLKQLLKLQKTKKKKQIQRKMIKKQKVEGLEEDKRRRVEKFYVLKSERPLNEQQLIFILV